MSETPPELFIVVQGMPEVFRNLHAAEECAAENARVHEGDFTVMLVPETVLQGALVASYRGVVVTALTEKMPHCPPEGAS